VYYKDDGDACADDTGSVRGRRVRRMIVLIREVQCRRIGLGRCKKMGRGRGMVIKGGRGSSLHNLIRKMRTG
jgi:hypothetical protein